MEARDYVATLQSWGLTQVQISERCEIPQPTISKVLRGDVKDVLSRNYRRLQALFEEVKAARQAEGKSVEAAPAAPAPEPAAQIAKAA